MKHYFNIHQHKKTWFTFSGTLVVVSLVLFLTWGLNLGLDFTGGTLMRLEFDSTVSKEDLSTYTLNTYPEAQISEIEGTREWNIKTRTLTSEDNELLLKR